MSTVVRLPVSAKKKCNCPAKAGEACPLTAQECELRYQGAAFKMETLFEHDGKQWGHRDADGKLHLPADTPEEVLLDAMMKKIAFSVDVHLRPHGEEAAKLDNDRIKRKLENKNRW